jgi:hypothetical protein
MFHDNTSDSPSVGEINELIEAIKSTDIDLQKSLTNKIDCNAILEKIIQLHKDKIISWLKATSPTIHWWSVVILFQGYEISLKTSPNEENFSKLLSLLEITKEFLPYMEANEALPEEINTFGINGLQIQQRFFHLLIWQMDAYHIMYNEVKPDEETSLASQGIQKLMKKLGEIINELLQNPHLHINALSHNCTPLSYAIFDCELIHSLVLAGADISLRCNYDTNQTPLELALASDAVDSDSNKQWLVHYFLALYSPEKLQQLFQEKPELEKEIKSKFKGALEWAEEMRKEVRKIGCTFAHTRLICKSAQFGVIPFIGKTETEKKIELPYELSPLILSFLINESLFSRDWTYKNSANTSLMYDRLRNALQPNEIISEEKTNEKGEAIFIDHEQPTPERIAYIKFVKREVDKICGFQEVSEPIEKEKNNFKNLPTI